MYVSCPPKEKMSTFSIMILIYLKFYFRIKIINAVNDGLLLKQFMEKLHMNPKHVKYLNKILYKAIYFFEKTFSWTIIQN